MLDLRLLPIALGLTLAVAPTISHGDGPVRVILREGIPQAWDWSPDAGSFGEEYDAPAMGFPRLPAKVNARGIEVDRPAPFALIARSTLRVAAGPHRLILRAKGSARLSIDGKVVAETGPIQPNASGHEGVPEPAPPEDARWREVGAGDQEQIVEWVSDGRNHEVELATILGARKLRPEPGELSVSVAAPGEVPVLVGGRADQTLTPEGWDAFAAAERARIDALDTDRRLRAARSEDDFWRARHEIARREAFAVFPPELPRDVFTPDPLDTIDRRIADGLARAGLRPNPPVDDASFLRRISLDIIGLPPTAGEVESFLSDARPDKRSRRIDTLLADPRWADSWMGYWQDVLAENPGILKPTLNNTGPFRRFLHLALRDGLSLDRIATELVRMDGSKSYGGPAGFGLATQNDAPMAAKAHILGKAFLAVDMKCARCHDAPAHPFDQSQLFAMAGMLGGKAQVIPATSTVNSQAGGRAPAVSVSLHAGDKVAPGFDLAEIAPANLPRGMIAGDAPSQERLAALLVSPRNARFARVAANRVWARYMGTGLVEPVDDWDSDEGASASHPELLDDLARDLVASGYDLKALARRIFNSRTYQARPENPPEPGAPAESRLFAGPSRRRMSAEQLVDSLFFAAGKSFGAEELCVDPEGRRPPGEMLNLGIPSRAWEFASTSNERDRPALSLPITQTFVDLMQTFGWRSTRQDPMTVREEATTPLQPASVANGVVGGRAARLSDDSAFTVIALEDQPLPDLVREVYLRVLSRPPTPAEADRMVAFLGDTHADRVVPGAPLNVRPRHVRRVSWSNHLSPRATEIQLLEEKAAREGDPPTYRLRAEFRERLEDVVWALFNSPEFILIP
ncbi:DUF1553 domain-containing protein [Tundrisphaera lichenicola]|uniref:DUF1553 domain-containing protein n=1 Tax=Tundrisphaera lichenicola TaxID=2029860 RepID=UPI003EBE9203